MGFFVNFHVYINVSLKKCKWRSKADSVLSKVNVNTAKISTALNFSCLTCSIGIIGEDKEVKDYINAS